MSITMASFAFDDSLTVTQTRQTSIQGRSLSVPSTPTLNKGLAKYGECQEDILFAAYLMIKSLVCGGSSTVAIDNKIEQAMDLVKSHLMFAVREEVDVLKEQIKELLEKNQQLEQENNVLKANAPPEVLQKLSSQTQTQTQPPTSSS